MVLLCALLPPALVACIQWDTLQQGSPRFFDKALGVHDADLVFTALDVDGIHLHVFVVEHKSRLRRHTVFQPLRYVVRTLEGWAGASGALPLSAPSEPMPRVHAVVVYHGAKLSRTLVDAVRHLPPHVDDEDPVRQGSLRSSVPTIIQRAQDGWRPCGRPRAVSPMCPVKSVTHVPGCTN